MINNTMTESQMETKVQYDVFLYTEGRKNPYQLTIEAAKNNLRLNDCLKKKIACIKSDDFIYLVPRTVTIDGKEYDIHIFKYIYS